MRNELVKHQIVIETRKIDRAKLYKLNVKNPMIKKFIDYYYSVIEFATITITNS